MSGQRVVNRRETHRVGGIPAISTSMSVRSDSPVNTLPVQYEEAANIALARAHSRYKGLSLNSFALNFLSGTAESWPLSNARVGDLIVGHVSPRENLAEDCILVTFTCALNGDPIGQRLYAFSDVLALTQTQ